MHPGAEPEIQTVYDAYHHVVVRRSGLELRVHVPGDRARAELVAAACGEAVKLIEAALRTAGPALAFMAYLLLAPPWVLAAPRLIWC